MYIKKRKDKWKNLVPNNLCIVWFVNEVGNSIALKENRKKEICNCLKNCILRDNEYIGYLRIVKFTLKPKTASDTTKVSNLFCSYRF